MYGFTVLVPFQSPAQSRSGNRAGPGNQGHGVSHPSRCTERSNQLRQRIGHDHRVHSLYMQVLRKLVTTKGPRGQRSHLGHPGPAPHPQRNPMDGERQLLVQYATQCVNMHQSWQLLHETVPCFSCVCWPSATWHRCLQGVCGRQLAAGEAPRSLGFAGETGSRATDNGPTGGSASAGL